MNSDYHEEPRLLLCNGSMERYVSTGDVHLHPLALSCPVTTAHSQLQQLAPDKSKTAKNSDTSEMGLSGSPCQISKLHPQVLIKRNLEWGEKAVLPYGTLPQQGLNLVLLTHYIVSLTQFEACQLLKTQWKSGLHIRYMWIWAMWGVDNSKCLLCLHLILKAHL